MKKNSVRTSKKIARKASDLLRKSKNPTIKSIVASALGNRRKK